MGMKARMSLIDIQHNDYTDLNDAFIQNVYFSNETYFLKMNCARISNKEIKEIERRKKNLVISKYGFYIGTSKSGVNFFAKSLRKLLIRRCVKEIKVRVIRYLLTFIYLLIKI